MTRLTAQAAVAAEEHATAMAAPDAAFLRMVRLAARDPAARAQFAAALESSGLPSDERARILFLFFTAALDRNEPR